MSSTKTHTELGREATRAHRRVLVAMSGGVDSSVAAAMLVDEGHQVVGATMKTFCYTGTGDHGKTCCGLDGIRDARKVARALSVENHVFDVEEAFTRDVIDDFVAEYGRGRTPNPCVRCNSFTKFQDLRRRASELGCDAVATGHYVRSHHPGHPGPALFRGVDPGKDQSYFLWGIPRESLGEVIFPVGALTKSEVRDRARALELVTAEKPESQEICFVPTGNYRDLLRTRMVPSHPGLEPGDIVDPEGTVLGRHEGYANFTVGQRKGLGGGFPEPMFVVEIRADARQVVVGPRTALLARRVRVDGLNWLVSSPPGEGARLRVQLRYRAPAVEATIAAATDEDVFLELAEPHSAVTPGQSAVFFRDDLVLGGGRIVEAGAD
jgi:tRNA-specific 2-thiouridylase